MNKAQQFEQNIRELLENTTSFDLEHLSLMEQMDFTALMQAIRHRAETVFVYRINSAHDIGRDYRSTELFPVRATLLYSRLAPYSDRDHGAVRLLELWMLTDGSFAVVANMQLVIGSGVIISEYRTVRTTDTTALRAEMPIDRTALTRSLLEFSRAYLQSSLPRYEL